MTDFDDDAPMTLDEAAEVLLRGAVTASTLRAAIGRRELSYERIGRRIVVTPADIRAWRKRCRIPARDRVAGVDAREGDAPTRFSPAHIEAQRASAQAAIADLAKLKPKTGSTGRHGGMGGNTPCLPSDAVQRSALTRSAACPMAAHDSIEN